MFLTTCAFDPFVAQVGRQRNRSLAISTHRMRNKMSTKTELQAENEALREALINVHSAIEDALGVSDDELAEMESEEEEE